MPTGAQLSGRGQGLAPAMHWGGGAPDYCDGSIADVNAHPAGSPAVAIKFSCAGALVSYDVANDAVQHCDAVTAAPRP